MWSRNICIRDVRSSLRATIRCRMPVDPPAKLDGRSPSWISNTVARNRRLNECKRRIYMQRGVTCCYRYSKSPFSTQGVRCVGDKGRYSVDEASAFVEPAPPSCGYLHISISSAQHRGGAVDVRLKYMDVGTRTLPFYLASSTCACFIVCVRGSGVCVARIQWRKFRCHGQPLPLRDIANISTYTWKRNSFKNVLHFYFIQSYNMGAHTPWRWCVCAWEENMYHQLETLLVLSRLYYLRSYYKSHFAGHSSLSIVLAHFNFRPRCKFHLRSLRQAAMTTSVYNERVICGCGRWVNRQRMFRFNSLGEP